MIRMTSAYANKLIRKLNEDKEFWRSKEQEGCLYVASVDEEPVIPEYNYSDVAAHIEEIDEKTVRIKHAINLANVMNTVMVDDVSMTIDEMLVRMSQLNNRKLVLDHMRKQQPKTRISSGTFSSRKSAPEYQYINYDLEAVSKEYDRIDAKIAAIQIALDKYNQTYEFDVDI